MEGEESMGTSQDLERMEAQKKVKNIQVNGDLKVISI